MPNATIEVRRKYSPADEEGIINAIHAAMMEALKTPEWDRTIRLVVHEPHRFATPPQRSDRYTLVDIDLFSGRSLPAKKALYQAIVRNLTPFGIAADHVKVLLRESPAENWGIRGGVPASEVELGFKVDVWVMRSASAGNSQSGITGTQISQSITPVSESWVEPLG
jgi:phenylpyruvate tautomerase PptA (4-oxalocrotonate tautomerase family)